MSTSDTKVCTGCGEEKPLEEYHKNATKKYGLQNNCKVCCHGYLQQPKSKFFEYRRSAKRRGYKFDLTLGEFNWFFHEPCYYCGKEVAKGLDRMDNDKGYELGNIAPCCGTCNRMKSTQNNDEYIEMCRLVANQHVYKT